MPAIKISEVNFQCDTFMFPPTMLMFLFWCPSKQLALDQQNQLIDDESNVADDDQARVKIGAAKLTLGDEYIVTHTIQ